MTEMSILVISLAATFYGENLIEGYNEAQEDKQTMEMVVNELEYNVKELADMKELYDAELNFSEVLKKVLVQHVELPQDSIETYLDFHRMYYYVGLKTNAFDIIKVAGTMKRMEDKELLVQLFECYELLDILKELDVHFREARREMSVAFTSRLPGGEHGGTVCEQWQQIDKDISFKRFLIYTSPSLARAVRLQIDAVLVNIHKTEELIKSSYGID